MDIIPAMDALSISPVLETIFHNLDTKTVAKCRLVNSTWNYEACNILRRRICIGFHHISKLRNYNETFNSSISHLPIVCNNFHISNELFEYAAVQEWKQDGFGENLPMLQAELKTFAGFMGHRVTQLRLDIDPKSYILRRYFGVSRVEIRRQVFIRLVYSEMVEMIFNYFPNLENLNLRLSTSIHLDLDTLLTFQNTLARYSGKDLPNLTRLQLQFINVYTSHNFGSTTNNGALGLSEQIVSLFIRTLLSAAVNLRYFLSDKSPFSDAPLPFQHDVIRTLASMSTCSRCLKEIQLPFKTPAQELDAHAIYNLPNLSCIHLELDSTSTSTAASRANFKQFFSDHSSSLQDIHISFAHKSQFLSPFEMTMKNLKALKLTRCEGSVQWSNMPSLKELNLALCSFGRNYSSNIHPEMSLSCLINLTVLTVSHFYPGVFPLHEIFAGCKQLKRLTVRDCPGITDQVLCGVKGEVNHLLNVSCPVAPLQGSTEEQFFDRVFKSLVDSVRSSNEPARQLPFIGNLKELQSLTLEGEFSDVAVLHGIIHCQKLKEIKLKSTFQEMSNWRCAHIIRQALGVPFSTNVYD